MRGLSGVLPPRPARWCVFISGRGSNLAALLETPEVDLRLVITDDAGAPGVAKARRAGVPVYVAPRIEKNGKSVLDWASIHDVLSVRHIDMVFLLGFMRIVPKSFVEKWEGKILNLHPSLLPHYPGLKSIERAHADGAACGASVHVVVPEVDAGPILHQRVVLKVSSEQTIKGLERLVRIDEQRLVKQAAIRRRFST